MFKTIRQNPGDKTAPEYLHILHSESFEKMSPDMRDHLLMLASQNARYPEVLGELSQTVNDPNFLYANDDSKWGLLNAFNLPNNPSK